jgi:Ferritin-like
MSRTKRAPRGSASLDSAASTPSPPRRVLLTPALVRAAPRDHDARLALLRRKLQLAIELEHSTIPPYLYALYSIKDGSNLEIAGLMLSIIKQEMLHMALDCNLLNAIGGAPKIDHPRFVPHYPGPLPGGVESGLIVPLAPLSKQVVHDVFMVIESPDETLDGEPPSKEGVTIGDFYRHIAEEITALSRKKKIFTGDPAKQVRTGFAALQNAGVVDLPSALLAIDTIVDQGEGTRTSPLEVDHELAHYYKYAEIYEGRKLIPNPDPVAAKKTPWVFKGHPIAFDPAGVFPVIVNPSADSYAGLPRLLDLNRTFNAGYSDLLRKLHLVFNGHPDWLGPALLIMQQLKAQAQLLMAQEVVPGQTAGPTFDYIAAG